MKADDLETYLKGLDLTVEVLQGADTQPYTVVRDLTITKGSLAGQMCDVAIQRTEAEPYVMPPAIHTRPHLMPNGAAPPASQPSGIGPEWQYWSRRYDRVPTPKGIWTHVLTVLGEV